MHPSCELGDLQLAVMRVLWLRPEASAGEVHAELLAERGLALTTVSTILQRLARRGLVTHRSEGRQFLYRALVSEPTVRRSMLGALVRSVFRGDPTAVVSELLSGDDVTPGDVERMQALLARADQGTSSSNRRRRGR